MHYTLSVFEFKVPDDSTRDGYGEYRPLNKRFDSAEDVITRIKKGPEPDYDFSVTAWEDELDAYGTPIIHGQINGEEFCLNPESIFKTGY